MDNESLAAAADALQQAWILPWQLTDLRPEAELPLPAFVSEDGGLLRLSPRWSYGVVARPPGRAQAEVLALSKDAARALAATAQDFPEGAAELWRLDRRSGATELLSPRRPIRPRPERGGPVAVLSDVGRVLVDFDHALLPRHFELMVGQAAPAGAWEELEVLLTEVERGALPPEELFERSYRRLRLSRLDKALFRKLWCSILFPLPAGAAWMRRLAAQPEVALTAVTNIDPWRLRHLREEMGLEDLLRYAVASYEDGVKPKHEDHSMWERAQGFCQMRLGRPADRVIVLDDLHPNLATAEQAGIGTHHILVQHPAQMWAELGAAGLYLPLQAQAAGR